MKPTNNSVQDSSLDPELLSAVDDIHQRFNDGERVSIDDYVKRFPQHEATLRQVFHTFQYMTAYGDSVVGASPTPSNPQEHTNQIGEFTVIRQVGRGGMGVVYEAYQGILDRRVALKILPLAGLADRRQIQRFKNEARAAATLHHTNIVPILSVGSDQGIHYYAMQFIDGPSLAEVIRELNGGSAAPTPLDAPAASMSPSLVKSNDTAELDAQRESSAERDTHRVIHAGISTSRETSPREYFRTVATWIERAADGLAHAHENGVLHRDIKPGNLMIDASGHVWITDFGLARLEADASLTATGEMLGTLRYMAPEQVSGQKVLVDHRADIYSLGLTLYELLTLTPAFPGNDRTALLKKIASFDPTSPRQLNARIPQELETIVLKATEKNPADRYMSAQELALDLARFLDNRPVLAKRPSLATRLTKWSLRHRTIVSTVAASLLVALIASSVVFWNANRRIRSTLDTLQDKNDELRLANERSAKTLNLARQAIDDVYVEFANKWVGEQSDLSPLQRDFLVSAAEIYTELCTEFLNDYELLLRTIEAQVGAANITAYLGDPDKANGWFKQAFDSMDYLNATKPMEVGLLAIIARGKADYGHHNFFNWDGRHTKVSSKQWLNNEVLPAVYALADYLEQAPDDHYAIEALAHAQASLFSHSSGISDHDWAKLKGQINRNVDRLKTQHPSPQILSQLSDTLQKAMTLEQRMLRNRETGSEDLQRLIADAELAIELAQQAYETSPTREIQQRLAWAYSQKANIQRSTSLKLLPEAVEGYRKAIQHTSGLAQQFPSRVEYWNDLCGQYMVLSDTHHEMGLPSARPEWLEYHEAYCEQHLREGLSLEFPDVARDFALVFKSNILTSLATFHGRMNDAKQSFECVQQAQQMLSQVGENASVMRIMYINRPAVMEANLAVQPFIPFTFEQRKQMLFDAVERWKKNGTGNSNVYVWAYDPNVVATRSYRDRFMNFYAKNAKELDEETAVLNLEHVMVMGAAPEILEQAAALAKRALEKSSESDANLARLWWIYARVSYERGQFDEALAWYRKLEETKQLGLYQSTRFEMCMVLEHLGRSDEARAYFSAGLKHIEEVWAIVDRGTANMMCRAALLLDEEARIRDFLKERWLGELDEFFIENQ